VHSVSQKPNLRHLRQSLGGTEGLVEIVEEDDGMYVMKNRCKCQKGVSSRLRQQQCWNHGKQRLCGSHH